MSKRSINLSIVIVNYQTANLVTQCLDSLLHQLENREAQVVIVDNCSRDNSVNVLRNWITIHDVRKVIHLLEAHSNSGFSAGNNLGIRAVEADLYLLLNSDTILRPEAVAAMLRSARNHPEAGIISPRLEWPDGIPQQSCFRYVSPISEFIDAAQSGPITTLLNCFNVPLPVSNATVTPAWTSFACVLVRREVIDTVGLMDEGFFMYFEDLEYCRRARKAGWNIVHNPEARIVHLRGGTSPVKRMALDRKRLPRYYFASRTRYLYLAYGRLGLTLANVLWLLGRCLSRGREILERRRPGVSERQWLDIWTNWLDPGVPWSNQQQ